MQLNITRTHERIFHIYSPVFDHFFESIGRSFNDFTGSYAIHNHGIQFLDDGRLHSHEFIRLLN